MKEFLSEETIAMMVARELEDGDVVNLGNGIPNLVRNYVPADKQIIWHSENGAINYGPLLSEDEPDKIDLDYVDAGGQFFVPIAGTSIVDSATSFIVIKSGKLDVSVLGAMQVSERGDLASWTLHMDGKYGIIGGAMDIATSSKKVIIAMHHVAKGQPKIVKKCSYPLTAKECVDTIVTDVAVIDVTREGLLLREIAPGWQVEEVQAITEAKLIVGDHIKEMQL